MTKLFVVDATCVPDDDVVCASGRGFLEIDEHLMSICSVVVRGHHCDFKVYF